MQYLYLREGYVKVLFLWGMIERWPIYFLIFSMPAKPWKEGYY
jgi:hypothetical protein